MLKEAIATLEERKCLLNTAREREHKLFQIAAREADDAAARRAALDLRIQEVTNGLLLLRNSDGLLERAGDATEGMYDATKEIDSVIDRELKRLLD